MCTPKLFIPIAVRSDVKVVCMVMSPPPSTSTPTCPTSTARHDPVSSHPPSRRRVPLAARVSLDHRPSARISIPAELAPYRGPKGDDPRQRSHAPTTALAVSLLESCWDGVPHVGAVVVGPPVAFVAAALRLAVVLVVRPGV